VLTINILNMKKFDLFDYRKKITKSEEFILNFVLRISETILRLSKII